MEEYNKQNDRRYYKRIDVGVDCLIHVNGYEINGRIENMSEEGIGVTVLEPAVFTVGMEISVTCVDEEDICVFVVEVVREAPAGGYQFIGCKIKNTHEVNEYIDKKKAMDFLKNVRNIGLD